MMCILKKAWICFLLSVPFISRAQRTYADHSVLASGKWYKLGITSGGIFKIDGSFLVKLGIQLPVNSNEIRLFGRNGQVPGEAGNSPYTDDLQELALEIYDGGDGQFSENDWLAFYGIGPDAWRPDSVHHRFSLYHNIYSDTAVLYLCVKGEGLRVGKTVPTTPATDTISSFQYRYHYENDLYNLLSSGQEWFGERSLAESPQTFSFEIPVPPVVSGSAATLVSMVAARSIDQPSNFNLSLNNAPVGNHQVAPVTSSNLDLFARESILETGFVPGAANQLSYRFSAGSNAAIGWINYFECFAEARLDIANGSQLDFRSWEHTGPDKWVRYQVSNADNSLKVWRVADPMMPTQIEGQLSGQVFSFTDHHPGATEYVAFKAEPAYLPSPISQGALANQDLHGNPIPQMILVTVPDLLPAANRLASWHQSHDGLNTLVVSTSQVFQEFSAGQPNPVAIRDFVKMFYDRAGSDEAAKPKYLLLLGDASFDYKNRIPGNTNQVPSYESRNSLDPLATYVSDDFFGFLDDNDDINTLVAGVKLDIGVGRIPAQNLKAANDYIDKIILYHSIATRGDWRNHISFIADDEDFNLHLRDAEEINAMVESTNSRFQTEKIYLDAYKQESDAAGSRYPAVNQAISDGMQKGNLVWNYSGHGGFRRLAEEDVLDQSIADSWQQNGRLPLFVTATCDFAPYDNPAINSLGEYLLLKPGAGAIGLMTTTRLVFAYSNRVMNSNYLAKALGQLPNGRYRTLGEAVRDGKNDTYQTAGDFSNNLKFTLLGDPAITLAFPKYNIVTDSINNQPVSLGIDTLRAQAEVRISGFISDASGNPKTDFKGIIFPEVFGKPTERKTLANDPGSIAETFSVRDQFLFKGRATVKNGRFTFSFVVPKDINYEPGFAKILYYATDSLTDANGVFDKLPVSGSVPVVKDSEGPLIGAWLNDKNFRDGGLTGESPLLILEFADSSGINILGNGIGHDIVVIIDNDTRNPVILNSFFESETDSYRRGSIRFRLPELKDGEHSIYIKAWDVLNNSSETSLHFKVKNTRQLVIENARAWPNPSTGIVRFGVNHNRGNEPLQAIVELFLINGQLVKRIPGTIIGNGNRSYMEWNGRDDRGNPVKPGIYFYRMIIRTTSGEEAFVVQPLIRF